METAGAQGLPSGSPPAGPEHRGKSASRGPHSHTTYLLTQAPTLGTVPQEEGPSVFQAVCSGASGTGAGVTGEVGHQAGFA